MTCTHDPVCETAEQHEERSAFRAKLLTLRFDSIGASERRDKDTSLSRDLEAYKTLRGQGVQPKHVFGSAEIAAQANTRFEAEHHLVMSSDVRKEFLPRLSETGVPT